MLRNIISKLFNRETYKSLVKMPSNSSENSRLFIIGCSHGMGSEIQGEGIGHFTETNLEKCYGSLVAKELKLEPVNLSWPGGSNDRMHRVIHGLLNDGFEFFGETYTAKTGDKFLIQWTGPDRIELNTKDGYQNFSVGMGFVGLNPDGTKWETSKDNQKFYKHYVNYIADPEYTNMLKLKNILSAKYMLDNSGYDYWMTESDRSVYNDGFIVDIPYWEYLVNKGYERTPAQHFGEDAHAEWARLILENIRK